MQKFTRTFEVVEQRISKKTTQQDYDGIAIRFKDMQKEDPTLQVEDIGTPNFKLRDAKPDIGQEADDREAIIAHVNETTEKASTVNELSPELQVGLAQIEADFNRLPLLHPGIKWADVERSLIADTESLRALTQDNADGFSMNVFGEVDGSYHFASAWTIYNNVNAKYRNIMFDKKAQTDYPQHKVNGNAVKIATDRGAKLSPRTINQQLLNATYGNISGWCWYETDEATRKSGYAFFGDSDGVVKPGPVYRYVSGSLRFSRRVKKV